MSSSTILNQRVSNLYGYVASGCGGSSATLSQVLTNGNDAGNQSILNVDDIDVNTINGSVYPPTSTTPTLNQVLTSGNTATNSIDLNNTGVGTNVISLLPNASATNPNITLTDGTTTNTNTIDKNGYTTKLSNEATIHYLNFSNVSNNSVGAIQKTSGLSCVPSTNTITASTFAGTATNAGTASTATAVTTTSDNTSGSYLIPFQKSSVAGNFPLFVDDSTTPLIYNPFTSTLGNGTTIFSGIATSAVSATNASNVAVSTTTDTTDFYPTFVSTTTGNLPIRVDTTFTYNPSTDTLTLSKLILTGLPTSAPATAGSVWNNAGVLNIV